VTPTIFPDWTGETVAVLAGGQSAPALAEQLRGRCRIIAVNLAFRLVPDADVVYAADAGFWAHYRDAHDHPGLKLSAADNAPLHCSSVHRVTIAKSSGQAVEGLVRAPVGCVGNGGGNGGFQAVNLAVQFGASTVLLAALDYCGHHWHGDHPDNLRNPSPDQLARWRGRMDEQAGTLRAWGVRVINLSETSSLRAYPHGHPDGYLPHPRPASL
jgi:hypothetical protein